jgi:hypothetical protein
VGSSAGLLSSEETMLASNQVERRAAYETIASPEDVPTYSMVPVRGTSGEELGANRGVQRDDTHDVVSVVSARYGLVGHRDVARAVHKVGEALELPELGTLSPTLPHESIRLYSAGRRMEVKFVVGRRQPALPGAEDKGLVHVLRDGRIPGQASSIAATPSLRGRASFRRQRD